MKIDLKKGDNMNEQIIIVNQSKLDKLIKVMSKDGAAKLHVIADFDRTLTRAFAPDGSEVSSLISILRDEGYLTPDYPAKAQALFDHYHKIEKEESISKEKRKKAMLEWWNKHFQLLIKSRLNKKDVAQAVKSQRVRFRQGVDFFLKFLNKQNVPLIIMSSSGLGVEGISLYLKNKKLSYGNIYIASNEFIWDANGFAIDVKQPIIHGLNKDETVLKDFPFYNKIAERKNVILLGDSLDDVEMITGFEYDNLIKIGFLNKPTDEKEAAYKEKYDVLIKNDGTLEEVNEILKKMLR